MAVECQYPKLAFLAVFVVNSSVLPAQTSTTQPPTLSTQHDIPEEPVYIQFRLVANFADVIPTEAKKEAFIIVIKQSTADVMAVNISRIVNVDVQPGSILVSFTLLPGGPGENNASTATSALMELVTNGNFSVTLGDGQKLVADPGSFLISAIPWTLAASTSQPSTATTKHEEEQHEISSDLSAGALVGIVVGSVLGVGLLIDCVILVFNKRGNSIKVEDNAFRESQIRLTLSSPKAFGNYNYQSFFHPLAYLMLSIFKS